MPPFHPLALIDLLFTIPAVAAATNTLRLISLQSEVTKVQPMTGIVLWDVAQGSCADER